MISNNSIRLDTINVNINLNPSSLNINTSTEKQKLMVQLQQEIAQTKELTKSLKRQLQELKGNEPQAQEADKTDQIAKKQKFQLFSPLNPLTKCLTLNEKTGPYLECEIKFVKKEKENPEKEIKTYYPSIYFPVETLTQTFKVFNKIFAEDSPFSENKSKICEIEVKDENELMALKQALTFAYASYREFKPELNYIHLKDLNAEEVSSYFTSLLELIHRYEIVDLEKECAEFLEAQIKQDGECLKTFFDCTFDSKYNFILLQETWYQAASQSAEPLKIVTALVEIIKENRIDNFDKYPKKFFNNVIRILLGQFVKINIQNLHVMQTTESVESDKIISSYSITLADICEVWIELNPYLEQQLKVPLNINSKFYYEYSGNYSIFLSKIRSSPLYLNKVEPLLVLQTINFYPNTLKRRLRESIKNFNVLIKQGVEHYSCYLGKGCAHFTLEEFDKSLAAYTKAIKINPNVLAYFERIKVLVALKKYKQALEDLENIVKNKSDFLEAWIEKGKIHLILQQNEQALKSLNEILKLSPSSYNSLLERAEVHYNFKNYKEALADLNKAYEINEKFFEQWQRRGEIYFQLGRYQEALKDFESIKQVFSTFDQKSLYLLNMGLCHLKLGNYVQACSFFSRAEKIEPGIKDHSDKIVKVLDPKHLKTVWLNRAKSYFMLGKYIEALKDYGFILKQEPNNYSAFLNSGEIFILLKKYELAMTYFLKAYQFELTDPLLKKEREEIYQKSLERLSNEITTGASKNVMSWLTKGLINLFLQNFDQTLSDLKNAYEKNTNTHLSIFEKIKNSYECVYLTCGALEEFYKYLDLSFEKEPQNRELIQKSINTIVQYLEKILEEKPMSKDK